MKELLEEIVRKVTDEVREGNFAVDYRNKAFVRVVMSDGLQVDFHKYGDVCLTYRGDGTLDAYLAAKRRSITDDLSKNSDARAALEAELASVDAEIRELRNV